ncbi:hypothetical protein Dimus_015894, partial [Dionaea muscipula]
TTSDHLHLMEKNLELTELNLTIDLTKKIEKSEENLTMKIDENSKRLTNVEETLANLLKAQQEQTEANKALTDLLISNFLGDAKKGKYSGGSKEQRGHP